MTQPIKLLDVVALTDDLPDRALRRGQVGTVVEELAPGVYEVEFINKKGKKGRTHVSVALRAQQILVLDGRAKQKGGRHRELVGRARGRAAAKSIPKPLTAKALLQSGLVGLWKNRTDLGPSVTLARKLRQQSQKRQWD